MVQIPLYVPVPRDMVADFESLRDVSIQISDLKETEKDMLTAAVDFLDQIVDSKDVYQMQNDVDRLDALKRLLESFESIVQTQYKTRQFSKIFRDIKDEVRIRMRHEPEFDFTKLNYYNAKDPDEVMFSRLLKTNMQNIRSLDVKQQFKDNADYNYLKNAAFILDHPLDPLPDENEDDDIQVEGGKIDLKCPLTFKMFEMPMTSTKCGHTFDQEGINGTWKGNNSMDCPIPGCDKHLKKSDFEPDRLMNLRVKCYKRIQSKLESEEAYEKL